MAEARETRRVIPPYVSYRTFESFLHSLKQGIPSRVDRTLMPSLSGSVSSQLQHALRYLGLVEQDGACTERLGRLVAALKEGESGERYAAELADVLKDSYGFLSADGEAGFDLTRATQGELVERFRGTGATGETVAKCVTFFLNAAKAAKSPLSPHINKGRSVRTRSGEQRPKTPKKQKTAPPPTEAEKTAASPKPDAQADETTRRQTDLGFREKLLAKFPELNPSWSEELQAKWFEGFDRFLKMVDQNEKGEGTRAGE